MALEFDSVLNQRRTDRISNQEKGLFDDFGVELARTPLGAVTPANTRRGECQLHSHRMFALFEKARVVDNPGFHGLAWRHGGEGLPGGLPADLPGGLAGVNGEKQQALVHRIRLREARAGTSRNGLEALALPVAQQSQGVDGKGILVVFMKVRIA